MNKAGIIFPFTIVYLFLAVGTLLGQTSTASFDYTGGQQSWVVPAGRTTITIEAYGAQGGAPSSGASGGYIKSTHTVTPGSTIYIYVGGQGTLNSGGYNGGGAVYPGSSGAFGGGGASDVRVGGTAMANRIIVAGGGGGTGASSCCSAPAGGPGGGLTGGKGTDCYTNTSGLGGTQSAGGSGSTTASWCGGTGVDGLSGSLGTGGRGGYTPCCTLSSINGGAGGGGGYYGGGGSSFGGAGGGSSYSSGTIISNQQGTRSGNGYVVITYASGPTISTSGTLNAFYTSSGTASAAQSFTCSGATLTNDITVTAPTGFEVSTSSGSGYAGSLTLAQSGGTVSSTTIYVRLTSSASGNPSGNVALTSMGASTVNVAASGTVYTTPSTQASNLVFSSITNVSASVSWTNGNGSNRAVFVKASNSGDASAVNGTTYTANSAFGSGTQIASTGWYCIYNGTGTSVSLSGLTTATAYSVKVVEYNGGSGGQAYLNTTGAGNPNVLTTTILTTLNYSGSITTWTVPAGVTTISIDASGAQGGTGAGYTGGLGARMKGDFSVTPGQVLKILVGQQGGSSASYKAGGGGGGSFVTTSGNTALIVAGGGSGGGGNSNPGNGNPGLITTSGGSSLSSSGGSGGSGGGASSGSAGGGGLTGDGVQGTNPYLTGAGRSFTNGGAGGPAGNCGAGGGYGGFGGGSGGEWCNQGAPGAGGGYSGGAGVNSDGLAGGGGSYNSGASPTNASGVRSGNGIVTITCYISPTIVTAGTFSAFTACSGIVSTPQNFTASGVLLTGNITITAPTGFEVSTSSGSGYAGSLTLTPAGGTVPVTTIYLRMATTAAGSPSGNVALTSPGATTINLAASGTVYTTPSTQATNITFSATTISQTNISWTNGNGGSRAVFMKAASSGSAAPVNATTYTASTVFGSGSQIGSSGWYCVYNGTGTSVVVTNLLPVTDYIVMVTDYNGISSSEAYVTSTASNNPKSFITSSSTNFTYGGSIVTYTVPAGVYVINIEAFGAQGGTGAGYTGGLGARMKGDFNVTPGQVLKILVGQQGGASASYKAGGGGGGSFVTTNSNTPLIVAGGGSGGGGNSNPGNGNPGLVTSSGGNSASNSGGTSGGGGGASSGSAGGGGLTGDGVQGTNPYLTGAGRSFTNGGAGGPAGNCGAGGGYGGFGGGSGGEWCNQGAPGAGGGYSGGAGVNSDGLAGGGGSYNAGSNTSNTAGARSGNGMVTITFYSASPRISVTGSLSAFAVCSGTASTAQTFTVSGANLTANISLTAPAGFEISTSAGSGYAGTLTLTQSGGTVAVTTIYVRIAASATGSPSGNIVLTSTDATTVNVAAAGTAYVLPSFSVHPSVTSQNVCLNGTATALSVTAAAGSGTISTYQWYKNGSASNSGGTSIGTNSSSYTPVTGSAGTSYYYCVVTNSNGCAAVSNVSGAITVNALPSFSVSPAAGTQSICLNGTAADLTVTAAAGSGTISSYQWYKNSSNSNSGGTAVGSNSATFTPATSSSGSLYYYCIVTNSNGCTATSNVSGAITINSLPPVPTSLTATPSSVCSGGTSNLNAVSAGNNIVWYTDATGGISLGTSVSGADFSVTPASQTIYYAEAVTTTNGSQTFNYTGSTSSFVVPTGVTSVTIDAYGAQGGPDQAGNAGGYGARTTGTFAVTPGETIGIAVGGQGTHYSSQSGTAGGGGGGSFVWHSSSYAEPMLAAGGGGGGWSSGVGAGLVTNSGGTPGNGAAGGTSGAGGSGGGAYGGGGGTGWKSDGVSNGSPGNDGGKSKFGFAGGIGYNAYGGNGGFGGGGGSTHGGGGGGGYSGGGGGNNSASGGGGGGSYNGGSAQTNTAGAKSGNGQVVISWNIVSATSCPSVSRTPVTVSITPGSVGGTATATAATLCTGSSTTISLTGYTGTIQWQQSANGSTGWASVTGGSGGTTATYSTPVLTSTTYYRAITTSGACSSGTSTTASVTVNPASVGGSVAGGTTVCTGTNSTTLTLSGHTGTVVKWQSSSVSNFSSNVTDIVNTTTTQTATNLTSTTYYRAVVQSGLCAAATSSATTITVNPASVGGSIAGTTTVCYGTNSSTLTLSGHTGSVTRWESSPNSDFSAAVTSIGNTTTSLTATNLIATTYYRAVVTNSPCAAAYSSTASVTVNPTSVGGTISGSTTVCAGTNSTVLTLAGNTGAVQWQSSANNVTFNNITGQTGQTYTASNLSVTTYYRAMVTSGLCALTYSAKATITVSPTSVGGTVSGGATVCTGTNSTTLTLSGYTGSITRWESSPNSDFSAPVTAIANATATLTAVNLTGTTSYRAVITSGSCAPVNSSAATVTVSPAAVGGTISGASTICAGTNSTTLTLNGSTGTIQWQSSLNNSTFSNIGGATSTTFTAENLTATTYYRAVLTSGACSANSNTTTMTVTQLPVVAAITGVTSVCPGSTTTLMCATAGGTWSTSDASLATVNAGVVSGIAAGNPTISYTVTSSGCPKTVTASVTVNASLAAPSDILATPASVQTGGNSNLSAVSPGNTISWYSAGSGGSYLGSSASGANYNVTPAATTTYYAEAGNTKSFYINSLTASNSYSLENVTWAGDDRGGIAVTQTYYYYTGDSYTARFDMPGLTNPVALTMRDGIFSDLSGSGTLYTLWNGTTDPVYGTNTSPYTVSAVRTLNADLTLGSATITLSSSISMAQGSSAVYSGSGFLVLQSGNNFYRVDLPSGNVTSMGSYAISRYGSESWATWGIAELNGGVYSILYRENSTQNINRLNLATGAVTTVTTFSNLSDLCCFTYAPWYNRWYFHHEGTSQFRAGDETAGYADGTHTLSNTASCPSIIRTAVTVTVSRLPLLTTTAVSSIGSATATGGGNITNDGGSTITDRGVCWNTSTTPTLANSSVSSGTGSGLFTSGFTGLTAGTTYYARAYATNSTGTSYGNEVTFTPWTLGTFANISKIYGDPAFALVNPTSVSNGAFTYTSSNTAVATVSGNTVTVKAAGTSTITATQAASGIYAQATTSALLTVGKANQVISFSTVPAKTFGDAPFALSATATSGLTVTFTSSNTSVATVSGTTVTIVGEGTATINADQAGNANYNAAPQAGQTITVGKAAQVITFGALTAKTFGDAAFTLSATGGASGQPVVFSSSNPAVATCSGTNGETVTIISAGSCTIYANQAAGGNYNAAAQVGQALTVSKKGQTISFDTFGSIAFGDAPLTLAATATSGLAVTYTSSNTAVATISGNTLTIVGAGSCSVNANQAGNANYSAAPQVARTLTVASQAQVITFDALSAKTFGDAPFTVSATGGASGNPVIFTSSNPAVATCTGTNGTTVTIISAGSCNIYANQAGNSNYGSAAQVSQPLTVGKKAQTITFVALAAKTFGDAAFTLTGTSSSGLPVSYASSNTAVATVSGSTVTIVGAGTTTITASQAGNTNFSAASSVARDLVVNKANQALSLIIPTSAPLNTFIGASSLKIVAGSSASLTPIVISRGTNSSTSDAGGLTALIKLEADGFYYLSKVNATGTIEIVATQAGNDNYNAATVSQIFEVTKGNQTITFTLPAVTYGDGDFMADGTATSGLEVSYASSNNAVAVCPFANIAQISIVGAGKTLITASQPGNESWNAAPDVVQELTVSKATPDITVADIHKTYGDAPFEIGASSASTGAFTFSSGTTSVATIQGNTVTVMGAGTSTITVTQAADNNFTSATVEATLTVAKANQAITLGSFVTPITVPAFIEAPVQVIATSNSGLTVALTLGAGSVATLNEFKQAVSTGTAGTVTVKANQAGNDNFNAAPQVTGSFVVGKAAQTITFAALANKTYGDDAFDLTATSGSGLPVSYASSNTSVATISGSALTIAGAGWSDITASQAGDDAYDAATAVVRRQTVDKEATAVNFSDISKNYGDAPFTLNATSAGSGSFTYASSDETVATISGNTVTLHKVGSCTISATQAADGNYLTASGTATLTVSKGSQSITFAALPGKTFGNAAFALSATSGSGLPINYESSNTAVATISGNTLTIIGAGTATISASQEGDSNWYPAASVNRLLTVDKATPVISAFADLSKTFGDADFTVNAISTSPGTISYQSSDTDVAIVTGNTVTITGAGSVTLTAVQQMTDNYLSASATATLTVGMAGQTITIDGMEDILLRNFDGNPMQVTASSTSGLAVTLTVRAGSVATLNGSDQLISTHVSGTVTVDASQAGDANYNPATTTRTITVSKDNQAILFNGLIAKHFGDPDFMLDGTTSSSLVITYTSSNTAVATISGKTVTIAGVGTTTITATQGGNAYYNAASSVGQSLVVTYATPAISDFAPASVCQGDRVTLNGTYLLGATAVSFGGTAATSFTVVSPTQITATAASGTSGSVGVTTPGGTAALAGITVYPTSAVGAASASASPICAGTGTTISLASHTGTIQWQKYNPATSLWEDIAGANGTSLGTGNLDPGTCQYHAVVTSGVCSSVTSSTVTVEVNPVSEGGTTASPTTTVCSGSSAKITLANQVGTIQWQKSPNGTDGWQIIAGATSDSYTTPALIAPAYYRAQLTSGVCSSAYSSVTGVQIDPVSVGGTASASPSTICSGSTSVISLAGNTGSIQWQQYDASLESWTDISGENSASYTTPALTMAASYRARVTSGACSAAYSTVANVSADPVTVSGTATAAATTVCYGSGTTLSLAGQTGTIQWQQSADGAAWISVSGGSGGTSTSYTTPNLTSAIYYRAAVTSGVCSVQYSNSVQVRVSPSTVAGTASATASIICSGNLAVINLAGSTGSIQWQESEDGATGWVDIAGATSATYTSQTLNAGTYHYRALVTSGVCTAVAGNVVDVLVNSSSILGGSVSGSGSITYGSSTGTLTLSANTGSVQKWQRKLNSGSWTDIANTSDTYSETPTSAGTWHYRAVVASGVCSTEASAELAVTVQQKELTVTGASVATKPYDGNTGAVISGAILAGKVAGDDVVLGNETSGVFSSNDKGTEIPVSTTMTISGTKAGSYYLTQPLLTGDITAKPITVTGAAVTTKPYDKTTAADITGATLSGVVAGDLVVLINASSGTFAQTTVGTGISVATTPMAITGTDASNYSLAQPVLTGNIVQKALSVTGIGAVSRPYNRLTATSLTGKAALLGLETGDVAGVDDTTVVAAFVTPEVGTDKTVHVTGLKLFGADKGNYSLVQPDLTADITAKELTVTGASVTPKVYDGNSASVITGAALSGIETGDVVTLQNSASGTFAQSTFGTGISVATAMTLSGADAGNYTLTQPVLTGNITRKELTVTGAVVTTKAYNGNTAAEITGATLSGIIGSDQVILGNHTSGTFAQATVGSDITVTTTPMTISGSGAPSYYLTQPVLKGTIGVKDLTITAINQTKIYGTTYAYNVTPSDSADYTVTGLEGGDTVTGISLSGPGDVPTASTTGSPYVITPSAANGTGLSNYHLVYVNGEMSVYKAMLTVSAVPQSKIYGDANPVFTFTYTGWKNGDNENLLTTKPKAASSVGSDAAVGVYANAIVVASGEDENYDFNYIPANLTITKAMLQVTADDKTKAFGDDNPMLTLTYSGMKNGESGAVLTTQPSLNTTVTKTSGVGVYNGGITVGGGVDENYDFTYTSGKFTVTKAEITVTADPQTRVYGSANPALTASFSGFVNGQDFSSSGITGTPALGNPETSSSAAGSYTITAAVGSLASANYSFIFVNGTLTITKAMLTVTAAARTKIYGDVNPALTFAYSGWVNGVETIDTEPSATTAVDSLTPVGDYTDAIVYSGGADGNYNFTYIAAGFSVTKATLTVTASAKTKGYGDSNPMLTLTYSGWKNSENETVLTTKPEAATTATALTPVGLHAGLITVAGGVDENYDFTYVAGNMTVTKAMLKVLADPQEKIYGSPNPGLTFTYTGWKNSENESVLTTRPIANATVDVYSPVGVYSGDISLSAGADENYDFTYVSADFTVTPALLTVTANNQSKVYGAEKPVLTFSYSGWVNGENSSVLAARPVAATTIGLTTAAGNYPGSITLSGGEDENYSFAYVSAGFTVTKAMLTATAEPKSKVYGSVNPVLTFRYSGWLNGDGESVLATRPAIITSVSVNSPVGFYPNSITVSGGADENYNFTYVPAGFTVNIANLTVTAEAKTKVYGSANPQLTFTYYGWQNGDNEQVLTTRPVASTTVSQATTAGSYPNAITVSGGADENYSFTYRSADFTVTPKSVVPKVTAENKCFDGNSVAVPGSKTLDGVVSPDEVILVAPSASFGDAVPGVGKTVTAAGLSLIGTKASSYVLSTTSVTTKADIFEVPLSPVSGPSTSCAGSGGYVYSVEGGMREYNWQVSSGGTITSGEGTNSIVVFWENVGEQTVKVAYTNQSGCKATVPSVLNIMVNPLPPPTITGSSVVCRRSGSVVYSTEAGMASYDWAVSAGGTIVSGRDTNTIEVYWDIAGNQTVSVNFRSKAGCTAKEATVKNVTVSPQPGDAGPVSGSTVICGGSQIVTYSTAAIANATSYVWTVPAGATIVSGNGSTSIMVSYSANAASGAVTVYGTNGCGSGMLSNLAVNLSAPAADAGPVSGPASVCQGSSAITFTVSPVAYATGYTWDIPAGATIASGAGTNSIVLNLGMNAISGPITVYGSNGCGRGAVSPVFFLTVNTIPATPSVTAVGTSLTSSATSGNQWFYSSSQGGFGTAVTGFTGQTILPALTGWYRTQVTLNGCASDLSNEVYRLKQGEANRFGVYPVPNNGEFTVEITTSSEEEFVIQVFNQSGQKIYELSGLLVNGVLKQPIHLQNVVTGVYSAVIRSKSGNEVMKKFNIFR